MLIKKIYCPIVFCLLLACASCSVDEECRTDDNVRLHAVLVCDSLTATGDTVMFNALDSIRVQGIGSDSLLLNNTKNVSSLSLPLRSDTTTTSFVVQTNGQCDTIAIQHTNDNHFVSLACGCFVYHTIENVKTTHTFIAETEIVNATIENYEQDNIRIHILLSH